MTPTFGLPDTHPIRQALALANGAQFQRCALQVNPYEYTKRHGQTQHGFTNEEDYNAALVAALLAANVEVIAVTDHWKARTGAQLIVAAEAAGIVVFPGFEASTNQGHHVLCLFEPKTPLDLLENLGGKTYKDGWMGPVPDAVTGGSGALSMEALTELIQCSDVWKGICIAAHVTWANGILEQNGDVSHKAWECKRLYASAIPGLIDDLLPRFHDIVRNKPLEYRRIRLMALVNAGDVNGPADVATPGKTCRIKLAERTVEGLRQAFLDPTPRIWLDGEPGPADRMELLAAAWDGGPLDGLRLGFNDSLNVLVGGRGTGKSSILETLRYALDAPVAGIEARKNHDSLVRHMLRNSAQVLVAIRRANPAITYLIERTFPDPPLVRDETGTVLNVRPVDVLRQLPEFFGQHEIAELARQKTHLTALLRRFLPAKAAVSAERKQALTTALRETRERLLKLDDEIGKADERLGQLPALRLHLADFEKAGLPARLAAHTQWQREGSLFQSSRDALAPVRQVLDDLRRVLPLNREAVSATALQGLPNAALLGGLETTLREVEVAARQAIAGLENALAAAETGIAAVQQQWKPLRTAADEALKEQMRALQMEKLDGTEYLAQTRQLDQLQALDKHRQALEADRDGVRQRRRGLLAEYHDLLGTERRELERTAERVNAELRPRVRARVTHQAARDAVRELVRAALAAINPGGMKYAPILDALTTATDFSLRTLAESCRTRDTATLRKTYGLTPTQADQLMAIGPDACMRLEELDVESETDLELNVAEVSAPEPDWRPLDALSVGQKATAVLRLLLLPAPVPLLIDQPEDDLDNRFIADDIVPIIVAEKKRRQFVFATHNANVPVLGDADLIVGLTFASNHITIGTSGALETPDVHHLVEKVLEGGKEAFARRRAKYNF